MNGLQIQKCMESDPHIRPQFQGVYAMDLLPTYVERKPSCIVLNSDRSQYAGTHWMGVYFKNDVESSCVFFDSLGHPPSNYDKLLGNFLERNSSHVHYNKRCLQSPTSMVCGLYVLYFSFCMCRNMPFESILSQDIFGLNSDVNDLYVYNFCKSRFRGWQ